MGAKVTRIVPVVDDGGNSGILREAFGLGPVGDIRNAIASMADVSKGSKSLSRLLSYRFPENVIYDDLKKELEAMVSGRHPLLEEIPEELKLNLCKFLLQYSNEAKKVDKSIRNLMLKNAAVGNLMLIGAYFRYSKDLNSAICAIRTLCKIKGSVWPTSLDGSIYLAAILEDGSVIFGENNITNLDRGQDQRSLTDVFLVKKNYGQVFGNESVKAKPNPAVIQEIKNADLIVYGPGSFFTSILPHLLIDEIAETIYHKNAPKILIGNISLDNETYKLDLEKLINIFITVADKNCLAQGKRKQFITHVIAHLPNRGTNSLDANGESFLPTGNLENFNKQGISIIIDDFQYPEIYGYHNPIKIAKYLLSFAPMSTMANEFNSDRSSPKERN
jgi:uncharacterized cofD-like protein